MRKLILAAALLGGVSAPALADELDTFMLQSQMDELQDGIDELQDRADAAEDAAITRYCARHYCNPPRQTARAAPRQREYTCLFRQMLPFMPCF
jgi:hypothetical protein